MPSFAKKLDEVGTVTLVGKKIGWFMSKPNPEHIVVNNIISDAEGVNYALLLIKSPSTFKLSRSDNIPNIIYTTNGSVVIIKSKITNKWELFFFTLPVEIACRYGCKVYELSD